MDTITHREWWDQYMATNEAYLAAEGGSDAEARLIATMRRLEVFGGEKGWSTTTPPGAAHVVIITSPNGDETVEARTLPDTGVWDTSTDAFVEQARLRHRARFMPRLSRVQRTRAPQRRSSRAGSTSRRAGAGHSSRRSRASAPAAGDPPLADDGDPPGQPSRRARETHSGGTRLRAFMRLLFRRWSR